MRYDRTEGALSRLESRLDVLTEQGEPSNDFRQYRDDPTAFARDILKAESATRRSDGSSYQFDALALVAEHEQVTFRSGHGCGKTALLSWLTLWWLCTRRDAIVIVLAPTAARQARGIVQREVERWARRASLSLRSDGTALTFDGTGSRLVLVSGASDVHAIEGFHAAHTLLLCDEAKGLTRDVLDALSGTMTGGEARQVMASTPGAPAGPFYDAVQTPDFVHVHIASDDSSLVSPRWIAGRARAWGTSSPTFMMRVKGEFPSDGAGQVFSWALLYASVGRDIPPSVRDSIAGTSMGIDLARSVAGDASCVCVVRDGQIIHAESWRAPSLTETAHKAIDLVLRFRPNRIAADVGGVGAGAVDRMIEMGAEVRDIHFGGKADDATRFTNQRAELYWRLRERLEAGTLALPKDDDLLAELACQRVTFDARGRIALASKDEIRSAIGRSPDVADALVLAVAPADPNTWYPDYDEEFSIGGRTFYARGPSLAERFGLATE